MLWTSMLRITASSEPRPKALAWRSSSSSECSSSDTNAIFWRSLRSMAWLFSVSPQRWASRQSISSSAKRCLSSARTSSVATMPLVASYWLTNAARCDSEMTMRVSGARSVRSLGKSHLAPTKRTSPSSAKCTIGDFMGLGSFKAFQGGTKSASSTLAL